jgi:hypothetical protein
LHTSISMLCLSLLWDAYARTYIKYVGKVHGGNTLKNDPLRGKYPPCKALRAYWVVGCRIQHVFILVPFLLMTITNLRTAQHTMTKSVYAYTSYADHKYLTRRGPGLTSARALRVHKNITTVKQNENGLILKALRYCKCSLFTGFTLHLYAAGCYWQFRVLRSTSVCIGHLSKL